MRFLPYLIQLTVKIMGRPRSANSKVQSFKLSQDRDLLTWQRIIDLHSHTYSDGRKTHPPVNVILRTALRRYVRDIERKDDPFQRNGLLEW